MAEQTKKSLMALVAESTEGTPVSPSSGNDYIALQDGYDLEPAFEELENAEFNGTIGMSKTILGLENPTASLNHYLRHSGVEGTTPNYHLLLKGAFGGETVAAAEYDTIAGSTAGSATAAPILKLDVGEGANRPRGYAVLIKDSVNGYSIRNVDSVATDDLTLNFNLPGAPALGVNTGKPIHFYLSENHPSFTVWDYRGNGAATQMIAGAKITEFTMDIEAAQLINGSFSLEGIRFYFDPIEITASNKYMDFDDGGGEENVSVAEKIYRDPFELASALQTAMQAATTDVITVTYSQISGKFTIASDGVTFELLWNTGTNTANTIGTALGFTVSADDTGATTYTSDTALDNDSPYSAVLDDSDPLVAKANEIFLGDFDDNVIFCASSVSFSLGNTKTDEMCVGAESGKKGTVMTQREITCEISGVATKYEEAEKFKRFRTNQTTKFMYNFGIKDAGNWVAGKCVNLYFPTCTISSFKLADQDGLVSYEITLKAFVDAGQNECYLNLL